MFFFKKSKRNGQAASGWYGHLAERCNFLGHRVSDYLQRRTRNLSPSRLRLFLLLFVLIASMACAWMVIDGLRHPSGMLHIKPISRPSKLSSSGNGSHLYDSLLGASLNRMQKFMLRMDSLKSDPEGRTIYDSIRRTRPGLFDSIEEVEHLYRQPNPLK